MENLVLSQKDGLAFFEGLSVRAGITLNSFGSFDFINEEREIRNNLALMKSLGANTVRKVIPQHRDAIVQIQRFDVQSYYYGDGMIFYPDDHLGHNLNPLLLSNTADCPTVIIYNSKAGQKIKVMALIHSGWRGTAKNIVGQAVDKIKKKLKFDASFLTAFIWPGICPACYKVGWELKRHFPDHYRRGHLDLKGAIKDQLASKGVEKIISTDACSCCGQVNDDHVFHSHRREPNGLRNVVFVTI